MKTDRYSLPPIRRRVKLLSEACFRVLMLLVALLATPSLLFGQSESAASDPGSTLTPFKLPHDSESLSPPKLSIPSPQKIQSSATSKQLAPTRPSPNSTSAQSSSNVATPWKGKQVATQAISPTQSRPSDLLSQTTDPDAKSQMQEIMRRLAYGPAFDAKVRQRVWAAGREVVGVGTYEQAGNGTGHFNLQVTMHDGDGRHGLQQICDGRLAWTKSVISERVSLSRVDVGRLNEWVRQSQRTRNSDELPARLRVGGWIEILDSIERDYVLDLGYAHSRSSDDGVLALLVLTGELSNEARQRIMREHHISEIPELFPTKIKLAVQTQDNPKTKFGQGLPVRIEYWSEPVRATSEEEFDAEGRLISLIEIYSIRPIQAPPIERFRFETHDPSINFANETDRYLRRYNIRLSEAKRLQR